MISYAFYGARTNVIKRFLHLNAELEYADNWGYTSVINAVFMDSHGVLELLLMPDSTNTGAKLFDGKTLLHVAATNSDLKTIEILQNSRLGNLDTAAVDAAGYTALDYVRQRKDSADLVEPFGALLLRVEARSASNQGKENTAPRSLNFGEDDEQT